MNCPTCGAVVVEEVVPLHHTMETYWGPFPDAGQTVLCDPPSQLGDCGVLHLKHQCAKAESERLF